MAQRFSAPSSSLGRGSSSGVPRSLIVLVVVSLVLCVVGVREGESGPLHAVRGLFQAVAAPARVAGSFAASPVKGIGNVVGNLTADQGALSDLKAENESLKAQVAQLTEAQNDADTLMGLLQLRSTYNLDSTAATVISQSTDSWTSTITIDKGTTSGIAVGMPVTSSAGVIGQVSEVGPTSATVRLITDESSGVSAKVQSSGAQGQLQGSADGTLRLNLIRTDQQVSPGDSVVTSGLGGVYPKGLPIGTVTNVTKSPGSMYYEIVVEPLTSVDSLSEVLVVTSLSSDQQATSDDAASANAQDRTSSTTASTQAATTTDATTDAATDESDATSEE